MAETPILQPRFFNGPLNKLLAVLFLSSYAALLWGAVPFAQAMLSKQGGYMEQAEQRLLLSFFLLAASLLVIANLADSRRPKN